MNLPKFPRSAMFVGVMACGKTEFLFRLLETIYKNHFEFIVILCPTILDNKTYLFRKWILNDKNVFTVCDVEGKLNEWIAICRVIPSDAFSILLPIPCSSFSSIVLKSSHKAYLLTSKYYYLILILSIWGCY